MIKVLYIGLGTLLLGVALSFAAAQLIVLPPDITILPPDPSLPNDVKIFSGAWSGQWHTSGRLESIIVVEKVGKDNAQVVVANSGYDHVNTHNCHCAPGWTRIPNAAFIHEDGKVTLRFLSGMRRLYFNFVILNKNDKDIMKGVFRRMNGMDQGGTFTRCIGKGPDLCSEREYDPALK